LIRSVHGHYSIRTLILVATQALLVLSALTLAILIHFGDDSFLVLNFEYGYYKILAVLAFVMLFSYWLDLYDVAPFQTKGEHYSRLLIVPGLVAISLALVGSIFPRFMNSFDFRMAMIILTLALFGWRPAFTWLAQHPALREKVYVLGRGERAQRLVRGLRHSEFGIELVGWSDVQDTLSKDHLAAQVTELIQVLGVHRVIVALDNRRGTLPVDELLQLRLAGVKIEEATTWLEKLRGRIEIDQLYPSWLIFSDGFRLGGGLSIVRRLLSILSSAVLLCLALPLIPFIILGIKLDSPGPVLYKQARLGLNGKIFLCRKFRTMRPDAEADSGPTWAGDDDPRITRIGRWLRIFRLDEIPQVWNVVVGDMAFVGPRPERPEFVGWLSKEIPFYPMRHVVRPGITGWAQIRYKYGNTAEDAKEKLQYDLFYIKNVSIGLDLLIMFQTIKIVLLGRGAH
jgi:sugar transferase (PEP-CTERM system associated)